MKGFVTVILFFLFALAFAGTEYVDAVPAASMTVCTVQHTDTTPQHSINEDRVIPLDSNKGIADMEFGDAHTLAHRVSASAERMYRFSSMETTQFIKILLRKMAARMASLASCHTHVYASSYSLPWDSACGALYLWYEAHSYLAFILLPICFSWFCLAG